MMTTLSYAIKEYNDDQLLQYLEEEIIGNRNQEEVMQIILYDIYDQTVPYSSLQYAICENKSEEVIMKLMDIGGRELIMMERYDGFNSLHIACDNKHPSMEIISKMLDIGGRELLMIASERDKFTALHIACDNRHPSTEIISKMLDIGGRELLMMADISGYTGLHNACSQEHISMEIISKMIDMGGRELLMMNNHDSYSALHSACHNIHISIEIISEMFDIGGKELLMMTNSGGDTALNVAILEQYVSMEIISKMLDMGGRELVMMSNLTGETAFHFAFFNRNISVEVISKMLDMGGKELLTKENEEGNTALHDYYFYQQYHESIFNDAFELLLKQSILAEVGGEFGIGGLFNLATHQQEIQSRIYEKWYEVSPVLKSVLASLQDQHQPPILHAAILTKAPLHIIQDIIDEFENIVLKTDSLNRSPLVVALEEGLGWNDGLEYVVEATALEHQQLSYIYTAAQYGLKWTHYMKELAKENGEEIMNGHDSLTGLRLFMVAAMGDYHDLSSIYSMMRMSPEIKTSTSVFVGMDTQQNKRRRK